MVDSSYGFSIVASSSTSSVMMLVELAVEVAELVQLSVQAGGGGGGVLPGLLTSPANVGHDTANTSSIREKKRLIGRLLCLE